MPEQAENQAEMPRYKCHKEVWALTIKSIRTVRPSGAMEITPAEEGYAPFEVDPAYALKHKPEVGGYFWELYT